MVLLLLKELLLKNGTLTNIIVPNNQIRDPEHIIILTELYISTKDRKFATISEFGLCSTINLPSFNKETMNSLEEMGKIQFTPKIN